VPAFLKVLLGLLVLVSLIGSQIWIENDWGTHIIEGKREPLPPQFVMVKVLTSPQGASVSNAEGEVLGYTPATLTGIEVDSVLELSINAPEYRELVIREKVGDTGNQVMVIDEDLTLFSPPIEGEVWADALGNLYFPESDRRHRSSEHVSEADWELFRPETGKKLDPIVFKHGGRNIVAVPEEWARPANSWVPSSRQMRFSSTSVVGFIIRV
jgi:hypothetical protein